MLSINILRDEELKETVNIFIGGMLSQENYDSTCFYDIYESLTKYIHEDEFTGEYYIILKAIGSIKNIAIMYDNYIPNIEESNMKSIVKSNIVSLIRNENVRIQDMLEEEGQSTNLDVATTFEYAKSMLYRRTMELYRECVELKISSASVVGYVPVIKERLLSHVAESTMRAQAEILNGRFRVGRRFLTGVEDWMSYVSETSIEIKERITDEDTGLVKLNDVAKGNEYLSKLSELYEPLAYYGIPPLDKLTPMCKSTFALVIANENTGKTKFAIDSVVKLLLEGKKVIYMHGETTKETMLSLILSNYIMRKYDRIVPSKDLGKLETLHPEIQRIVKLAMADVLESGLLWFKESYGFKTFYEEARQEYQKEKFDAIFIDHTGQLGGEPTKENFDAFSKDVVKFKKNHPVFAMVLSHLSSYAKSQLSKGKEMAGSGARGSANLSQDADEVYLLSTDSRLQKQKLIQLSVEKTRGGEKPGQPIFLRTRFDVSSFIYDESLQNADIASEIKTDQAIDEIKGAYEDDFDIEGYDYEELPI